MNTITKTVLISQHKRISIISSNVWTPADGPWIDPARPEHVYTVWETNLTNQQAKRVANALITARDESKIKG